MIKITITTALDCMYFSKKRDNIPEIALGSYNNKLYVWYANGSTYWEGAMTAGVDYANPAIGDLDGDDMPEVIVGSQDNKIHIWYGNGTTFGS